MLEGFMLFLSRPVTWLDKQLWGRWGARGEGCLRMFLLALNDTVEN